MPLRPKSRRQLLRGRGIFQQDGIEALRAFLLNVPDHDFQPRYAPHRSHGLELMSHGDSVGHLMVTASGGEHWASVNVEVADQSRITPAPHKRPHAFDSVWESRRAVLELW